jgi:hypothetical protein
VGRKRLTKLEQSGHDSCSAGVSELAGSQGRKCLAQDRDRVGLKTSSTSLFGCRTRAMVSASRRTGSPKCFA